MVVLFLMVIIFIATLTVFPIIDGLDPNGYITYRLVRDSTDFVDGQHVKNLDCLNRDLSKVRSKISTCFIRLSNIF
ncbi:hypothetical protein LSTR_LSTR016393 [Laodelphax striatellus]|uniref:FCP1 homology domain-containing protein n=1 Tax=Laodelphax striatellus TaxID=195883 RepID=A0A482WQT5_LAOST|nr:hypothetical protein LSTR_LSTR016393 [Laodelphax striatellus]